MNTTVAPSRSLLIAAFAAIYLIWGSTYLVILYAIDTMPPFLMAGCRFLIAGGVLFLWARLTKASMPNLVQWRNAAIVGALLLLCGNGLVVWAEQYITSSIAALLITTEPVWVVLLVWRLTGVRPSLRTASGLLLGVAGMIVLVGTNALAGIAETHSMMGIAGMGAVVLGTVAWATGSVFASRAALPPSPLMTTSMQMLSGGALQILVGTLLGEWARADVSRITLSSWAAFAYLIVFGSIVAFTAYSWLTRVASMNQVSTYAYVNPVIAVFLGWAIAGEPLTLQTLLAAVMLVTSVAIIISAPESHAVKTDEPSDAEPQKPVVSTSVAVSNSNTTLA